MQGIVEILGPLGAIAVIGWIIKIFINHRRILKLATMQVDLQTHLIDKFDSADELRAYLESDVGQTVLATTTVEKASPFGRILGSIQAGVILTFGGLALFLVRSLVPLDPSDHFGLVFLGSLAVAVGLGFLLSAAAAFWLSKSWGLINGNSKR